MRAAFEQVWPAFVLVAGLLLAGRVAADDGVLAAGAALLERTPGPPMALLAVGMVLEFLVTAVLNLDTAVVFLTPVLVLAARRRGTAEAPFLYAAVLMANASSLALPGANLTNLIALSGERLTGGEYLTRYAPMAVAAAAVTGLGILVLHRRSLRIATAEPQRPPVARPGLLGVATVVLGGGAVIVLPHPALPVLAICLAAVALSLALGRSTLADVRGTIDFRVLGGLFVVSVLLGTLARELDDPAGLADAGAVRTAITGAIGAIVVNNLPAASLLAAEPVAHPGALLLGLGIGPNLAVTGSLSAYLWWQAARTVDAHPSALALTRHGIVLAPLAIVAGLLALG